MTQSSPSPLAGAWSGTSMRPDASERRGRSQSPRHPAVGVLDGFLTERVKHTEGACVYLRPRARNSSHRKLFAEAYLCDSYTPPPHSLLPTYAKDIMNEAGETISALRLQV